MPQCTLQLPLKMSGFMVEYASKKFNSKPMAYFELILNEKHLLYYPLCWAHTTHVTTPKSHDAPLTLVTILSL